MRGSLRVSNTAFRAHAMDAQPGVILVREGDVVIMLGDRTTCVQTSAFGRARICQIILVHGCVQRMCASINEPPTMLRFMQ